MKQVTATVISNDQILEGIAHRSGRSISGVRLIWLDCPQTEMPKPGQFVMVRCGEECVLPRPFSIHQVNDDKIALWIAVWEDGKGTQWLADCKKGDTVELVGPLGNGFPIYPSSRKLLLLAGGIGIAPLRFLADEAIKQGLSVTLLCGTPTAHRYPEDLLPPQIKLVTITEDGSVGQKGLITDLLPDYTDRADQIFACGPVPMYKAMAQIPELKLKLVQISLEVRMGCGRGVCYGCTVKTKRGLKQVCTDGPVFDLDDVLWD